MNSSELASNVKRPNLKRSKYGLSEATYGNVGVKSPLNNGKLDKVQNVCVDSEASFC